ncbi:putative protein kinase RLK-Pelle-RLCK-VIIa-2 family [Helianthus anomalus]
MGFRVSCTGIHDMSALILMKELNFESRMQSNLETLKEFVHPSLVKLIGYSFRGERLYLLYEFMHKGNLGDLLRSGAVARLPLVTKMKIVVGIARGIVFLQKITSQKRWSRVGESSLDRRKILLDEVKHELVFYRYYLHLVLKKAGSAQTRLGQKPIFKKRSAK